MLETLNNISFRAFAIAFSFPLVVIVGCSSKSINLERIENLKNAEKYDEAIAQVEKELEKGIDSNTLFFLKGHLELMAGKYDSSIADFRRLTMTDQYWVEPYFYIGECYVALDNYDSAFLYFNKAIQLRTSSGYITDIQQSVMTNSIFQISTAEIMYNRGVVLYNTKNFAMAKPDFSYCIGSGFNLKNSYLYSALCNFAIGDKLQGCQLMKEAEKLGNSDASKFIDTKCK